MFYWHVKCSGQSLSVAIDAVLLSHISWWMLSFHCHHYAMEDSSLYALYFKFRSWWMHIIIRQSCASAFSVRSFQRLILPDFTVVRHCFDKTVVTLVAAVSRITLTRRLLWPDVYFDPLDCDGGLTSTLHPDEFFLFRFNDIDINIRRLCTQASKEFIVNHPELVRDVSGSIGIGGEAPFPGQDFYST